MALLTLFNVVMALEKSVSVELRERTKKINAKKKKTLKQKRGLT